MFIEMIIALAIILFVFNIIMKSYFNKSIFNAGDRAVILEQGGKLTDYKSVVDATRSQIEDIQKKHVERMKVINIK